MKGVCPDKYGAGVPADLLRRSIAKGSFDNGYRGFIEPDIFPENVCGYRFDRGNLAGSPGSPQTEGPDICPDIDYQILGCEIRKTVFRNLGYLPE
jgi:hypothetical protein